jgi:Flp pilus assembly protein TadG
MAAMNCRRWRSARGAELVEFALVLPLLLLLIAGIVDFGFLFQHYLVVTNAAREGARIASLPGYSGSTIVEQRVRAYLNAGLTNVVPADVGVTVTPVRVGTAPNDFSASQVTVTLRQDYIILDTIGELASLYALADIAFVGGSLVPRGGHNILEPAQH